MFVILSVILYSDVLLVQQVSLSLLAVHKVSEVENKSFQGQPSFLHLIPQSSFCYLPPPVSPVSSQRQFCLHPIIYWYLRIYSKLLRQHASHSRVIQVLFSSFITVSVWSRLSLSLHWNSQKQFCLRVQFALVLIRHPEEHKPEMFLPTNESIFYHRFCSLDDVSSLCENQIWCTVP